MVTPTLIPNGTYTTEQLSRMGGRTAWNVFIPAEEGRAIDAARGDLIREAIDQIQVYEILMGLTGAAEIVDGQVAGICES